MISVAKVKFEPFKKMKSAIIKLNAAVFLIIINTLQLFSQDSMSILKTVIVTESKSLTNFNQSIRDVQIITQQDILAMPATSINDVLLQIPGVDIMQRGPLGAQADINIRGGSFEQTLILINGVRFNDAQTGHHNLNIPVALEDIDHIEVLKGAASRIFGISGLTGAINIILKKAKSTEVNINLAGGDFNYQKGYLGTDYKTSRYDQRVSLSGIKTNGYRTNTDFRNVQGLYFANSTSKILNGQYSAGVLMRDFGANSFYSATFPLQFENTKTYFGNIKLSSDKIKGLDFSLNYRGNNDYYVLKRDNPLFYRNIHFSQSMIGNLNYSFNTKFGQTILGGTHQFTHINSTNLGIRQRNITDFFVEQKIALKLNGYVFTIIPGLNFNSYNSSEAKTTKLFPSIDLGYSYKKYIVYANASQSYRQPSFTELYYKSSTDLGNNQLKAESVVNYEGGIKYIESYFYIQSAVYYRSGKNLIDYSKLLTAPAGTPNIASNIIALNTFGVDLNGQIDLSKKIKSSVLGPITLGYSYIENKNNNSDLYYKYSYKNLRNQFTGAIIFNYTKFLSHEVQFRSAYRVINQTHYNIADTKLNVKFTPSASLYVAVTNIFNKSYYDFASIPMPGRWFMVGTNFKIGLKN